MPTSLAPAAMPRRRGTDRRYVPPAPKGRARRLVGKLRRAVQGVTSGPSRPARPTRPARRVGRGFQPTALPRLEGVSWCQRATHADIVGHLYREGYTDVVDLGGGLPCATDTQACVADARALTIDAVTLLGGRELTPSAGSRPVLVSADHGPLIDACARAFGDAPGPRAYVATGLAECMTDHEIRTLVSTLTRISPPGSVLVLVHLNADVIGHRIPSQWRDEMPGTIYGGRSPSDLAAMLQTMRPKAIHRLPTHAGLPVFGLLVAL